MEDSSENCEYAVLSFSPCSVLPVKPRIIFHTINNVNTEEKSKIPKIASDSIGSTLCDKYLKFV
jgi:hypothetical protein